MSQQLAFLNGRWVGPDELHVPIYDTGFVLGATVTEQLRTFGGRLFRLESHLERLSRSLDIVRIDPGYSVDEFHAIAEDVVAKNHSLLAAGDDVGVGIFVTPGAYPPLASGAASEPMVCVYSYPLPFGLWANRFESGQTLRVSDVAQVSPRSWPPELKCRSRMHYYLADLHAHEVEPTARAVLLDHDGYVNEASTANVVMYRHDEGIVSPPRSRILPGISLRALVGLAEELNIPCVERDFRPEELLAADEVLLTSTSVCVLPVVRIDGQTIGGPSAGKGRPGPIYRQLLAAWSKEVGVDIAEQARQFAKRNS